MSYQYNRRPRRRVTGRFYALLTLVVVLVVMLCVFLSSRGQGQPNNNYQMPELDLSQQTQTVDPQAQPVTADPAQQPSETAGVEAAPTDAAISPEANSENGLSADTGLIAADDIELEPLAKDDLVQVENLSVRTNLPSEWRNILLLGSDTRDMEKVAYSRCDTIIIASINAQTGQIKLTSLMRDMMINIPGRGMNKITSATYFGGPDLLMKLINENLGMNITEYAIVNFAGFAEVIDILGGVLVDITKDERDEINAHIGSVAMYTTMDQAEYLAKRDTELKLATYGQKQRLMGIQAVTYARIRKIDSDYQRTERQRKILNAILEGVKDASLVQVAQIANSIYPYVKTNVGVTNAIGLAYPVVTSSLGKDRMLEWRMPGKDTYVSDTRNKVSALWDIDYPQNARLLHKFIYGSDFD